MAVQRHSTAWIITLVAIPTLVVGLVIPIIASQRARQRARAASATSTQAQGSAGAESSTALQAPEPTTMSWQSAGAALFDVNGDGVMDVLGRILLSKGIERDTKLAAFDGATGEPLWMSEELKLHSDDTPGPFVITDDTLVFPPNSTSLRAFGTSDGAARWTTSLPEKLRLVCRSPQAGSITLLTEDGQWHTLALADGKLEALVWESPCRSLQGDSAYLSRVGQLQIEEPFQYGNMALGNTEGMLARAGLFDIESEVTIALAYKYPGSEVPMLARYEHEGVDARLLEGDLGRLRIEMPPGVRKELDRKWYAAAKKVPKTKAKVLWSVAIPSSDPLKAKAGAPSHKYVALQDAVVVAAYESGAGGRTLTAFDATDGARLWEVDISGGAALSRLVASSEYVFAVHYGRVSVFGLRDGHLAYSIPK